MIVMMKELPSRKVICKSIVKWREKKEKTRQKVLLIAVTTEMFEFIHQCPV
jgi:hypothetical protein